MGTVGVQEMVVIFLVALVLFGPKKLPELGRTIGKAITEFRRASNDLKATFEREMHNLEQETASLKETHAFVENEIRSATIDYSMYELPPYGAEAELPPVSQSAISAAEVPGQELHGTAEIASHEHAAPNGVTPAVTHVSTPAVEGTVHRTDVSHSDVSHTDVTHSDVTHSDVTQSDATHSNLTPPAPTSGEAPEPAADSHQHQLT